jgi:hypothetical protein
VEDFVETITAGHVTEVKIVLTTVVAALAIYQVLLMLVGWGWVRLPFFTAKAASFTHRSAGDAVATVTLIVGDMCYGYFGISDGIDHAREVEERRVLFHVVTGVALLGLLAFKIAVVRWWRGLQRFLPVFGFGVLGLYLVTWWNSSGAYL